MRKLAAYSLRNGNFGAKMTILTIIGTILSKYHAPHPKHLVCDISHWFYFTIQPTKNCNLSHLGAVGCKTFRLPLLKRSFGRKNDML